jgi:hypothetical protein
MKSLFVPIIAALVLFSCKKDKSPASPAEPTENIAGKIKTRIDSNTYQLTLPVTYNYYYNDKGKLLQLYTLRKINGNNYYDTVYTEKYLYNGKEVVYTTTYGDKKYVYKLNDDWLVYEGTDADNPQVKISCTYNNDRQLTEFKYTGRDNRNTPIVNTNKWYYTNGVCDSLVFTGVAGGITYDRQVYVYEYDKSKINSTTDYNLNTTVPVLAEIFGAPRFKYPVKKVTTIYPLTNSSNFERFENKFDNAGKLQTRKIFGEQNNTLNPEAWQTFIYY